MTAEPSVRDRAVRVLFISHISDMAGDTAPEIMDCCEEAADALAAAGLLR